MKRFLYVVLFLSLLLPVFSAPVAAKGNKVDICHLNDNGEYHLINVSENAVDAHLAHGDPVIGVDVNENCEPLPAFPQGCFLIDPNHGGLYYPLDGSNIQSVGGQALFTDAECTIPGGRFISPHFLIWAANSTEATGLCTLSNISSTLIPTLFRCYGT